MKRLIGMQLLLVVLAGCGPVGLTQEQEVLARMNSEDVLKSVTSQCEGQFSTNLREMKNNGYSLSLGFAAKDNQRVHNNRLPNQPSLKERCQELLNSLSIIPNEFKFEISFDRSEEQAEQMRAGQKVSLRPESGRLEFTDGSLNNAHTDIKLRCPDSAQVACVPSPDNDRPCASFDISYTGKCTFTSKILFYTFSDLKRIMLDLMGEVDFYGANGAEIKFTSVSWRG